MIAIAPGSEPETCDLFRLSRGALERHWCLRCWREAFVREAAA